MNSNQTFTSVSNKAPTLPSPPGLNDEPSYFDKAFRGLPAQSFNLMETADNFYGLLSVANFLATGLKQGEIVTLIAFDRPENVLNKFLRLGHDFKDDLRSGRMVILSYKTTFTRSLNISTDYQALFSEINLLSKNCTTWLAFLNADLLFNLESYNLTTISVSKIHEATQCVSGKILAQFTTIDDLPHKRLRDISASLLDCYLVISEPTKPLTSHERATYS